MLDSRKAIWGRGDASDSGMGEEQPYGKGIWVHQNLLYTPAVDTV